MDDVTMALQHAVDVIPAADPNSAEILTRFALLFEEQFQETDSLECIESAISTMQRAISATREGDLYLAKRFSTLGRFLKDKFLETGKIPDIEQAIVYAQQAFDITTEQPDRSVYLSNVGIYLQEKFGVTDDIADIKKAITCMEDIIKSYPRDQKFPARLLNSLGSMFGDLFKTTGEVKDIDQAIQHTQAAWNLLSPDDPDFGQFSGDLGSLFGDRLEVTGDKQSLEAAMKYAYMAIEKTDEERPSYPIRLNNFGSLLLHQYLKDSRLDDLQKAIEFTEDAVHRSAKHPGRPVFLSNLSSLLGQRFERERKKEDIDTAVNRAREAVSATDKNHPDLPRRMNNLGLLLQGQSKAQAAQDKNQLMEAIEVTSNAVNATSEDDPNLPLRWNNVALLYAAGVEKPEFSVAESSQNWLRNSPVHSQSSSMTMTESSIPEDATDWEEDSDVELCTRVFDANGQAESALSTALDPVKKQMVDRLMEEFWVIFSKNWPAGARQCPGAPTQGHSAEPASASKLSTRISSGETPGGSHTRGNRGEEDPDEGPAKWPGGNGKQPESPPSENQVPPVFACPYRKHNPRKYCVRDWRSCALSPQKTVARVKGHLYRYHIIHQCQRCKRLFSSNEELDSHIETSETCDAIVAPPMDGITRKMKLLLQCKRKAFPGQTEAERWKQVYQILFPLDEEAPDPYFDPVRDNEDNELPSLDPANLTNYEDFLRRILPQFVRSAFETQINSEIQPMEDRLRGQIMDVIEQAQNRAFQEYRSMIGKNHNTDPSVDSGYASNLTISTSSLANKGKGLASNAPAETSIPSMAGPEIVSDLPEALRFPFLEEDATFGSKSTEHIQQHFPPMSSSEHFHFQETVSDDYLPSEAFFSRNILQSDDQSAPNMMDLDSVDWARLLEDSNSK